VREFTVPATVTVPDDARLTDMVVDNAREAPDTVSFSRRTDTGWEDITAATFATEVAAVARGLVAAGVGPGERVAIMSANRYEWTLLDYAIWTAGAAVVPIYETSSAEQVEWIIGNSGSVAVIVESATHLAIVDSVRADLPDLRHVWTIEAGAIDTLVGLGTDVSAADLEARRTAVVAEDVATVIYTSGTTGRPKGCELTHRNVLFEAKTTADGLRQMFLEGGSTLLFLPLAHIFGRMVEVGGVLNRVRLGHTADVKRLLADFATFRPTFVVSVPRVFEKVYNASKQKAHGEGKGKIFDLADRTAVAYSEALDRGKVPLGLKLKHRVMDKLVYSKLRAALGGQCDRGISGGAPLGARLGHFFRGVGITLYEGYGLTETTAGGTLNFEDAIKIGTVGRPVPGVAIRIADDGEVLLRGDFVMRGHWRNEAATAEVIDADGWFHTGDIGSLDDEGFLTITGRKKELLVTSSGKNVAPAVLEDRLRGHFLVSQCMVVGDQQPFIGCLVTIDPDAFGPWKKLKGKPEAATVAEMRDDPDLRAEIQAAVDDANKAVSRAESIRSFRILPEDFTEAGGELTPSLKLKRSVVMKEYADEVAAIYA